MTKHIAPLRDPDGSLLLRELNHRVNNELTSTICTISAKAVESDDVAVKAALLNKLSLDGTIKHLVVVSDPRTLGEMRKHFHRDLRGKIMGEFAKDFSRRPLEDIASLIANA